MIDLNDRQILKFEFILDPDCVESCISIKKTDGELEEEEIYIQGIEYNKETKQARIIPNTSGNENIKGEVIKGVGVITQWVDKIDKSYPKQCNGQENV